MRAWSHRTKVLLTLGTNHDSGTLIRPASPSDINFASGERHYWARNFAKKIMAHFSTFESLHSPSPLQLHPSREMDFSLDHVYRNIHLALHRSLLVSACLLLPQATTLSADTMSDSVEGAINVWLCIMRLAMTGYGLKRGFS